MNDKPREMQSDLVAYQRSLCDEETLAALGRSKRPSPAMFYKAARGEYKWTTEERQIIDADCRLQKYEDDMRAAVKAMMQQGIIMRPVVSDPSARQALRAVARAANDTLRFENTEEGYEMLLFPADEGRATIRFVGVIPQPPIGLLVDDSPVEFIEPIDKYGYTIVRAEDIRPVQTRAAELRIKIE